MGWKWCVIKCCFVYWWCGVRDVVDLYVGWVGDCDWCCFECVLILVFGVGFCLWIVGLVDWWVCVSWEGWDCLFDYIRGW